MRKLYIFGLIGLAAVLIGLAWADQMTFTTYYPAPYGVYNNMRVMDSLGVGTTQPERTLHIAGTKGMRLEPSSLPTDPDAGDIAVDSGDNNILKWYDGNTWQPMGGGGFGIWNDINNDGVADTVSFNIVYRAQTDGFVVANVICDEFGHTGRLHAYTSSANPPSTRRASATGSMQHGLEWETNNSLMMPVKKDHYWRVLCSGNANTTTLYWIPLGN